ncbi:Anti-sigma-I factor RsgI6 [Bulinus truncatus]|nr:Anti-sigma-I factor RsgI6 [Bulinus truncatus]
MFHLLCQIFIVFLWTREVHGATELLHNPGFESGLTNWTHDGFTMTVDKSVVHGGTSSVKCTGRSQNWMGPAQYITPKPGARYAFSAYIKLINDIPGTTYQTVSIKIDFRWKDTGLKICSIYQQIDHKKHLFGFGSQMTADYIVNPDYKQFQNIAYHMFNWATIGEYKWNFNCGTKLGHIPLYGQTLKDTVDSHIRYMTNITKGKLSHWDVNNELLHGRFFETHTGDEQYSFHMFRSVHASDPTPKLFLNDYSVMANGEYTQASRDILHRV